MNKTIKTLCLTLTMCLTFNACDSLMGVTNDVHYLSKSEKKHEKTERKRHERLLVSNAEDYKKQAEHYKAQAEILAKKVNDLNDSCDNVAGWCTALFVTTICAVGYIIYDKNCSEAAIEAKAKALKTKPSGFEPF